MLPRRGIDPSAVKHPPAAENLSPSFSDFAGRTIPAWKTTTAHLMSLHFPAPSPDRPDILQNISDMAAHTLCACNIRHHNFPLSHILQSLLRSLPALLLAPLSRTVPTGLCTLPAVPRCCRPHMLRQNHTLSSAPDKSRKYFRARAAPKPTIISILE